MLDLQGKVAVITGAASGIGLATAWRLAEEKMRLVLADSDESELQAASAGLEAAGHTILGVPTDVARAEDVERLAGICQERFGPIHLLFNNAGVTRHTGQAVWELSLDDWSWLLGVNLQGVIFGLHFFVPAMLAHGQPAHIVNTASLAGLLPGCGAYGASKHAVVSLTESLHCDLRQRGSRIGVSCLCPGLVRTRIARAPSARPESEQQQAFRHRIEQSTQKHGVPPEKVAQALWDGIQAGRFYLTPGANPAELEALLGRPLAVRSGDPPLPPPLPSQTNEET